MDDTMNKHAMDEFFNDAANAEKSSVSGFLAGTRIRTEHGERAIETLQEGDRIITRNGKLREISSIAINTCASANATKRPIIISKGALGNGIPRRDLFVAQDQRILVSDPLVHRLFDCTSVLIAAKDLLWLDGVEVVKTNPVVTYVTVSFDEPGILYSSGVPAESHRFVYQSTSVMALTSQDAKTFTDALLSQ